MEDASTSLFLIAFCAAPIEVCGGVIEGESNSEAGALFEGEEALMSPPAFGMAILQELKLEAGRHRRSHT